MALPGSGIREALPAPARAVARAVRDTGRGLKRDLELALSRFRPADISLFHEFAPPPTGGGHQFLRALRAGLEARGYRVENNTISPTTFACLANSFNFDVTRLRKARRATCRIVHRVDGPVGLYRGTDDAVDRRIAAVNREFAARTIVQSRYSLEAHERLGIHFVAPVIIPNAPDPAIFHDRFRRSLGSGGRIRLVATSWSDNPRKGADVLAALEAQLDWSRFELTFIGRSPVPFQRIRSVPPVASRELGDLLRQQDIYLAVSQNDPCSNALIEAMACGLPVVFRRSGGHPELVGEGGLGFDSVEELPGVIARLADEYELRRQRLAPPRLDEVVARYIDVLREGQA